LRSLFRKGTKRSATANRSRVRNSSRGWKASAC